MPAARSKPSIWFQDFGQQGTLIRIWAERGTRPRAPRDTRYIWSYIFGSGRSDHATCRHTGLSAHLAEIAKTVASGAHAFSFWMALAGTVRPSWRYPATSPCSNSAPYSPDARWKMLGLSACQQARHIRLRQLTEQIVHRCCGHGGFFAKQARQSLPEMGQNGQRTRAVGIIQAFMDSHSGRNSVWNSHVERP